MRGIKGQLIFEDEVYALFQGFRFGLRHPILCPFFVILKTTGATRVATLREKLFLLATTGEMAKLGVPPKGEEFKSLWEDFSQAIFARGFVRHHVFFSQTPQQTAALYV